MLIGPSGPSVDLPSSEGDDGSAPAGSPPSAAQLFPPSSLGPPAPLSSGGPGPSGSAPQPLPMPKPKESRLTGLPN